jgi:hypothetical protein
VNLREKKEDFFTGVACIPSFPFKLNVPEIESIFRVEGLGFKA